MVRWAREFRRDPVIIAISRSIVANVPNKDFMGEAEALLNYVRNNVRYTQDPNNVEMLQWPTRTLELRHGDCDDMALLLASMLESIGHPARFAAVSCNPQGDMEHVLIQTMIGEDWISADPTEPNSLGWSPPDTTAYLIRYV